MTLRRRVMTALISLVALFTLIQGGIAVLSLYEQEDELVDELVLAETHRLAVRLAESSPAAIGNSLLPESYEAWWVGKGGSLPRPLPVEMKDLTDGPHLDSSPGAEYHIMVMPVAAGRLYVRYNAVRNEGKVRAFAVQVFVLALVFIGLAALIAKYVTSVLIAPLEKVAQLLDHWAPASEPGEAPPADEEQRVLKAFAGAVLRRPRLCRAGLWLGLGVGTAFSFLQVAKGAHFMSDNLWAAAIDLWMAALVFSPLMAPGRASPFHTTSVPAEGQK